MAKEHNEYKVMTLLVPHSMIVTALRDMTVLMDDTGHRVISHSTVVNYDSPQLIDITMIGIKEPCK